MSLRLFAYKVHQKSRAHSKEVQRFLVVGTSNFVFSYTIYLIANIFLSYSLAFTISFAAGILFSAYWNSRISFSTPLTSRRLAIFAVVCVINYLVGLLILNFLVETIGVYESLAPILVIIAMIPLSFMGTRLALVGSLTMDAQGLDKTGVRDDDDEVSRTERMRPK